MTTSMIEEVEAEPKFETGELVECVGLVVMVDESTSGGEFSGQVVYGSSTYRIGVYSKSWTKDNFLPFRGKLILESK